MSVYKSKRGVSSMEFIKIAQQISTHTITNIKKFPKSYRFNVVNDIYRLSTEIYENVLKANAIYVSKNMTEMEYLMRRKHLVQAKSSIFAMSGLLTIVFDMILKGNNFLGDKEKASNIFQEWARLLNLEHKLIKGVLDSDKKKWNTFKKKQATEENNIIKTQEKNEDMEFIDVSSFVITE